MKSLFLIFLITFICLNKCFSQITIQGTVKDTANNLIIGATVTVKNKKNNAIVSYCFSNKDGFFKLEFINTSKISQIIINVKALNFEDTTLEINPSADFLNYHFFLKSKVKNLNEVIVQTKAPITQKKDTLNYQVENFISNYDRVIGDVLQKLPGIEVLADGTIKYQGKPINKFYIDGKNLLDGRYNIATNNVPADAVDKVQVLDKHQPIKLLDSFLTSNRAAINLVLKTKAKNRIIGKAKIGIGSPLLSTDNEIVPLYFSKNYQSISTIKYNNIGKDYSTEFKILYSDDIDETILLNTILGQIISINKPQTQNIDLDRFYYNNQITSSINLLKTTKKNNEIKFVMDYINGMNRINGNSETSIFFSNDTFQISEQNNYNEKNHNIKGSFQFLVNKSNLNFSNNTNFQFKKTLIDSRIINPLEILQSSKYNNTEITNETKYMFKRNKHVFSLSLMIGLNEHPQKLQIQNSHYDTFFTKTPNPIFINQEIELKSFFVSTNAIWAYRIKSNLNLKNVLNLSIINQPFYTNIVAGNKDSLFTMKDGFSNNLLFSHSTLSSKSELTYKFSKANISLSVPFKLTKINTNFPDEHKTIFKNNFIGFETRIEYSINKNLKFSIIATKQIRIMPSYVANNNFLLNNYRSVKNNNGLIHFSDDLNFEGFINYKNISKYVFVTLGFSKISGTSNLVRNNQFLNNLNISTAFLGSLNSISNNMFITLNKYYPKIKTSFTLQTSFQNTITDNYLNKIITNFYNNNYQFSLKSNTNFKNFSIDNKIKYNHFVNWNNPSEKNQFSVLEHLLTLKASISSEFFITLNSTYNILKQDNKRPLHFLFPDFFISYNVVKWKTEFELGCQNLFNKSTFTYTAFYGNSEYVNQLQLRPFQVLLKASLYFK